MFVPAFSPDGTKLVYINADSAFGPPSHSVGVLDVAPDTSADAGPNGGVLLSSPKTIYDSTTATVTPAHPYTRVPMFLTDSKNIVFQQTDDTVYNGYDGMLPNYTPSGAYTPGALYTLRQNADGSYTSVALASRIRAANPNSRLPITSRSRCRFKRAATIG